MAGQAEVMERVAARVKQALDAADLDEYADLLDPAVRWGAPGDPVPPCRDRAQVLAWYRNAREAGASARVTETVVSGDKILIRLRVMGTRGGRGAHGAHGERGGAGTDRWQVLTVDGGRITAITGFGDQAEAAAWAGLIPGPPPRAGAIRWAAPQHRLTDTEVELRLPEPADAAVLHSYASRPDGLADGWVPLPGDASLTDCQALVGDWLAGWGNRRSFHGPALIIATARTPGAPGRAGPADRPEPAEGGGLAGVIGLGDRGDRMVELAYGVAPDRRGRGYATRAARLAARWLLHEGRAGTVELHIARDNTASQRVAAAAGFTAAGPIRPHRRETGESGGDLRFVMRPDR